jgi:glycosyltransferase involved in cell wall biosynthesis
MAKATMRVLAITNEFPLPLDRGGPVRFYGLSRAIAAEHEIHLLALARENTTELLIAQLRSELRGEVEVFERSVPGGASIAAVTARWSRAIVRGIPPEVSAQHSAALARRAVELAPGADAVVLLDDYAGIYAHALAPVAPVVCDKSMVMAWSAAANPPISGLSEHAQRALRIWLTRRFERGYVRDAALVVVTSDEESRRLKALYGRAADAVVPSAVDLPERPAQPAGARAVGWLGTHEYSANVEGLVRFVEEAWEPLGQEGLRLLVAGRNPPAGVRALERLPGVEVLGYVERLDEFLGCLDAAVVPLWSGAGVKLKTLTFMAAGVAVAATPVALEGIEAEHGRHCLVAHDPGGLAAAVRDLVADVERARLLAAEARDLVKQRYTWRSVGPRFVSAVELVESARS